MFRKVATAAASLLLLVGACAREVDPGALDVKTGAAALTALRSAPDVAADVETAQFEMVMEMAAMGESFELVASGAMDDAAQQLAMSMDMSSLFSTLAGDGEQAAGFGDQTMEVVVDGTTVYVKSPFLSWFGGTAAGWVSLSADEFGASAGDIGVGATDPDAILDGLRGVGGEPEVVGQEAVRGVDTTHYRATMDLGHALAEVPEANRARVEAALEQMGDIDGAEVPIDVWIDADGLPRRLQVDMSPAMRLFGGTDAAMTVTLELFGYGEPVDIDVPSADEVTPISELMAGLDWGWE